MAAKRHLPAVAAEPLSGTLPVGTGNFPESDGHDVVDQGHQRGVEVGPIGWTKMGSPSLKLLTIGPEPEPVHVGNSILFHAPNQPDYSAARHCVLRPSELLVSTLLGCT